MPNLTDTLTALAAQLSAAGLRATIDARDLNPPGCLVAAPTFRWAFGGRLAVDYRLIVVAPNTGTAQALRVLSDMMDTASSVLAGVPLTATPTDYVAPGGGDPLPAYEVTWTAKTTPTPPTREGL